MKKYFSTAVIFFILCAFLEAPPAGKKTFKKLHALAGTWQRNTKRGLAVEEWRVMDKFHLQGRGYYLAGKDTITTEKISLQYTGEEIFYSPTAFGQNNNKAVDFKLTAADLKNLVFTFEDPEHDFPKRIIYEIITADSLHAWVDGGSAEPGKRQDFYFSKVK